VTLNQKAQMTHGDVSWSNAIYRRDGDQVYGVLNDFDFAHEKGSTRPAPRQRIRTRLYMSIDSLRMKPEEFQPRARHDLESLYYVLLITLTHYQLIEGNQAEQSTPCIQALQGEDLPYVGWFDSGRTKDLAALKESHFLHDISSQVSEGFSVLNPWIDWLRQAFIDGLIERSKYDKLRRQRPPFDEETLGGRITLSNFIKAAEDLVEVRATDLDLQL
jgi:hypothetical protein